VIDSEGQVFSFGINEHGQLGQDDHQSRNVPTLIENQEMGEIISVSVGSNQSLLLNAQGQIFGCGLIAYIPSLNEIWSSDRPVRLESINKLEIGKIIAISTGGNSSNLILNSQGRVFSLKLHEDDETTLESKTSGETFLTWIDISQTGKIAAISAGSFHSLLLNTQGQVFSFGEEGRLGFDDDEPRDSPTLIDTSRLGRIVTISAGESHSLLLNDQGQVYSFGFNNYGQLGVGDQENKLVPTLIENFEMGRVVNISAGYYHSLVLNDRGQVFGFGYNRYGQLGLGDRQNRLIPTLISIEGISAISAGALSSLLLDSQGELFSFGQPGEHLGLGDQPGNGLSPALIKGLIL
jgi:alpha-tubulin suppressor-like RCC1 family protein